MHHVTLPGLAQEEGLALTDLSAAPDGVLYKDSIIRFWAPRPHSLPYHTLAQGDIVLISKTAPGETQCRLHSMEVTRTGWHKHRLAHLEKNCPPGGMLIRTVWCSGCAK